MMLQRLIAPINLSHHTRRHSVEPDPSQESGSIALPQHLHTNDRKYFQESAENIENNVNESTVKHKLKPSTAPKIVSFTQEDSFSFKGEHTPNTDEEVIVIDNEMIDSQVSSKYQDIQSLQATFKQPKKEPFKCQCSNVASKALNERQYQCRQLEKRIDEIRNKNTNFIRQQFQISRVQQKQYEQIVTKMTQKKSLNQENCKSIDREPLKQFIQKQVFTNSKVQSLLSRLQLRVS